MPPVENDSGKKELKSQIQELIDSNQVIVFSKSYCPFCVKVKDLFKELQVECNVVELDLMDNGTSYQEMLLEMTGQKTVPNVFINKKHIGGCDKTLQVSNESQIGWLFLSQLERGENKPRGCQRMMPLSQEAPRSLSSASTDECLFLSSVKHNWDTMKTAVNNYIGSLNWGYRVSLRDKNVNYVNAYAEFVEPHKIKATNKRGKETFYTGAKFVLATGERPRYLGIPGDKEYCITSDDLFSLPYCPGKTLVIGASYVALECGGFLAGLGLDVTVMVRSILLRGFDQDMANRAGEHMEEHGVKFLRKYVPTKIEELEAGTPGRLKVTAKSTETDEIIEGEYNTVLIAVGRDACTDKLGLDMAGVKVNPKNGKIPVNDEEQTNVPHIHAIGDILEGKWELTPVAIQAGKLLARRLYGGSTVKVFTTLDVTRSSGGDITQSGC
uniref:Thioredoxin reductase 3 n=1 Tax=Neolamprologus brichardi TaxID=32507 RepID=A0A3Q4HCF7_NEOBR